MSKSVNNRKIKQLTCFKTCYIMKKTMIKEPILLCKKHSKRCIVTTRRKSLQHINKIVGEHILDADGQEIRDENHIGNINPYRYRGYRYDNETQMYYLQSRYYNSEWGRFLNADSIITGAFVGNNLYAYCFNNPVNLCDPNGNIAIAIPFVEAVSQYVSVYWPAVWQNIGYGATVAWNSISSAWNSAFGVKPSPKVESSGPVGGCGGFERSMPVNTSASPPPQVPKPPKKTTSTSTNTSKGSTAQIVPSNLREQLALEQVKSMPSNGKFLTNITMNDPRWPATQGWVKMQQIIPTSRGNVNIHYVWNTVINIFDDFKIVP